MVHCIGNTKHDQKLKEKKKNKSSSKERVILLQKISKGCVAVLQRPSEALPKGKAFFINKTTF